MNTALSWIKAYVPGLSCTDQEYFDAMTLSGTKVEGMKRLDKNLEKIVIGQIVTIEKHPDADKLIVCQVDVGTETIQIVTGAPNVKEGDKVPVVLDGGKVAGSAHGRRICHRVAVMKDGQVVELGTAEEIFERPRKEYTRMLVEAVPSRMKRVSGSDGGGRALKSSPVLEVRNLSVYYQDGGNSLFSGTKKHRAVEGADFAVYPGESLGLVGESGCGKTSLSKAILGMNRRIEGEIIHHSLRPQMVFQDPYSSLNPAKTIGWLLQEPLRAAGALDHSLAMTKGDMEAAAYDMLRRVGMGEEYFSRRPSELSGGQRQRVSIAQALIAGPGFLVADEPVSALDVTIQAQIMELMQSLQREMNLACLFISHDINVVYKMCDRIMIMKDGRIIETGETEEIFDNPKEEYTKLLLKEG